MCGNHSHNRKFVRASLVLMQGLMIALLISTPVQSVDGGEGLSTKEIRDRRLYRTKDIGRRLLDTPHYVLEMPWYPIKKFLDFSERTDLFTRISDLFWFNDERTFGWSPVFSSGGSGEGIGASLFHTDLFKKKHAANATFSIDQEDQYYLRSAYSTPLDVDHPNGFKVEIEFINDEDTEIYVRSDSAGNPVLGDGTTESDRNSFSLRRFRGRVRYRRQAAKWAKFSINVQGEDADADKNTDLIKSFPPLPPKLSGLNDTLQMWGGGSELVLDLRDDKIRPFAGGFLKLEGEALATAQRSDQDRRYGYSRYIIDARAFIPVLRPHRAIMLRHYIRRVDPIGSREVPFYHLAILDLNQGLRSFGRNRFRDRGIMVMNAEYRYPIYVTWDAFVFFDAGQSFEEYDDLRSRDLRFSQGFGIRAMSKEKHTFSLQVGFGKEGTEAQIFFGKQF